MANIGSVRPLHINFASSSWCGECAKTSGVGWVLFGAGGGGKYLLEEGKGARDEKAPLFQQEKELMLEEGFGCVSSTM